MRNILLSFAMTACGAPTPMVQKDSTLHEMVQDYFKEAWAKEKSNGNRYKLGSITYVDSYEGSPPRNQIGECFTDRYIYNITILRGLSPDVGRAAVYHELGHCVYDLDHTKESGIMSAIIPIRGAVSEEEWEEMTSIYWDLIPHWNSFE